MDTSYFFPRIPRFSYGETIFLILLGWYTLQFLSWDVNTAVMDAWIHGPNLIFHEAGHVIFSPFGEFIMILGGSLGQILMPLIVAWVFVYRELQPYSGAIGVWWLGQNLSDIALYISDARARDLPLIGGMGSEAHDWGNLLTMMDMLEYDHTLALMSHYLGMILMISALLWAGYIEYLGWREEHRTRIQ